VRKRRILDAAARVLARDDGATRVTMDQVAAEANVAKGTMYHYWGSRAALFHDLQQRYVRDLCAAAEALTAEDAPGRPLAALESFLRESAALHHRQRPVMAALMRELPLDEAEVVRRLEGAVVRFVESLDDARPAADPAFVASFLLAGLRSVLTRLAGPSGAGHDRATEQAIEVCRRVLGLPEPPPS
jgi:AcrR family transcriptional regulator